MNWGVIGYGEIAPVFIQSISAYSSQKIKAIASTSKYEEIKASGLYPDVNIFSNYNELLASPEIDIVYIATTNQIHKGNVISALKAGKHVLCEKPLAVCEGDLKEIVEVAQKQNKFLLEGMWTRFLPAYRYFKQVLESGIIGSVNFVQVDFGFNSNWGPERRLRNKALYGGAVLDNCDYTVFLAQDIFDSFPSKISAFARKIDTEVEDLCAVMLQYPSGGIAQLFCSFNQQTKQEALIYGDRGHIRLKEFWRGTLVEVYTADGKEEQHFPFRYNGFEYEIEEVVSCITVGKIESGILPHRASLEVASIMDKILKEISE